MREWLAPQWAPRLPVGEPGSSLNAAAAFGSAFLVVLIGCGTASRVLRLLVSATPLKGTDRRSAAPSACCAARCCCWRWPPRWR
ncbi:MAG: CvpA family protein [Rubrivivax sp.]